VREPSPALHFERLNAHPGDSPSRTSTPSTAVTATTATGGAFRLTLGPAATTATARFGRERGDFAHRDAIVSSTGIQGIQGIPAGNLWRYGVGHALLGASVVRMRGRARRLVEIRGSRVR
jgi:hypothetical protein